MSVKVQSDIAHVIGETTRHVWMGKSENAEKEMLVFDGEKVSRKKIKFSYGLLKIFDEIIVNAIDNLSIERKSRSYKPMSYIRVSINEKSVSIENDGPSIPIEKFKIEPQQQGESDLAFAERTKVEKELVGKYHPEIVFTVFRSSTNYVDRKSRTTGGANGIGAKMTCAFSSRFLIEVWGKGKKFIQEVRSNCREKDTPVVTNLEDKTASGVKITFEPDWSVLDVSHEFNSITPDQIQLLSMRVFDLCHLPIKLYLNEKEIPRLNFIDFAKCIEPSDKYFYCSDSKKNWFIAFAYTNSKAKQRSYVNNVVTYDGGSHVKWFLNELLEPIQKAVGNVKTISITNLKAKVSLVMYTTIPGAEFDSQSKDKLVIPMKEMKDNSIKLDPSVIREFVQTSGIVEDLSGKILKVTSNKITRSRITGIKQLIEAELAPTPRSRRPKDKQDCTLFVCEGDSAQTLCVQGIRTIGASNFGSFALRGKVLNTQKTSAERYQENKELTNLKKIIGLNDGMTYTSTDNLRYQKIVCATDADYDGSVIKGLIINFFHDRFPSLLKIKGFISELNTGIIALYRKSDDPATATPAFVFYNNQEFQDWLAEPKNDLSRYSLKFIKGLGGNTNADVNYYFSDYKKHVTEIDFQDENTEDRMQLAFAGTTKKFTDRRKEWIATADEKKALVREAGKPISFVDFVDYDLVFASKDSCGRSINGAIDGLKVSHRKVLYTFFGMPKSKQYERKLIYQLTGLVSDYAMYHHGDASMSDTITRMCQDFVGSNNLPLLRGYGQVGSRRMNGDDKAKPRYVGASLAKITRKIFPEIDDRLLEPVIEDGKEAEPKFYVPIIPLILVNGARGIGTGWSTRIPLFKPRDLITITAQKLAGHSTDISSLSPWYRGYGGEIYSNKSNWEFHFSLSETKRDREFRLTEIPVDVSVQDAMEYIDSLIDVEIVDSYESLLNKDSTRDIDLLIRFKEIDDIQDAEDALKKIYMTTCSKTNLVAYDRNDQIHLFKSIEEIFNEWFEVRFLYYQKRIALIISDLEYAIKIAKNKYRFIDANYDLRTFSSRVEVDSMLEENSYDRDKNDSYEYLWGMSFISSAKSNLEKLAKEIEKLEAELEKMKKTLPAQLWIADLEELDKELPADS